MIFRVLGGALLGGTVLLVWGYLFWAVLLPPGWAIREAPDQPGLARALRTHLPRAGTYLIPHVSQSGKESEEDGNGHDAAHLDMVRQVDGVIAMIHYDPRGGDPLTAGTYFQSFFHFLGSTLAASLLLAVALPGLGNYFKRAGFVFCVAVFGIFAFRIADPFWYRLHWDYFLYASLFLVVGWAMAALVIAAMVRPGK